MARKIIRIIIHPFFIFFVITILECIPYYGNDKKAVLDEMPKVGDNFSVSNEEAVFYFNGKGKFAYTSIDCFISCGNPPFNLSYKKGGIKTIKKDIADRIPYLGNMCTGNNPKAIENKTNSPAMYYLSTNYLLTHFSDISHVLVYFLLVFSTIFHWYYLKNKYYFAFFCCFMGGAFLELIQHCFIVGRNASWEDLIFNSTGIFIGIAIYWLLDRSKFVDFLRKII